jgi:DNA adenine methylase
MSHKMVEVLNNKSPLRYPGGKTRACKVLCEIISQYFPVETFEVLVSPFFGGGSFEFYFQNKYGIPIIANDKFAPLISFWNQVKTDKKGLCMRLKRIPLVSKEMFIDFRKTIMEKDLRETEKAIQYFIINRCSFSGATLSGGFSQEASKKRYTISSIDRVEALDLSQIQFFHMDFEPFIYLYYTENTLLFLDPPYYLEKSNLYGKNGDLHEDFDHVRLCEVIKKKKRWVLTYNDCEYIRELYKDFKIIEVEWSYGMNKSKESSEIVILCV